MICHLFSALAVSWDDVALRPLSRVPVGTSDVSPATLRMGHAHFNPRQVPGSHASSSVTLHAALLISQRRG